MDYTAGYGQYVTSHSCSVVLVLVRRIGDSGKYNIHYPNPVSEYKCGTLNTIE